jgi:uncharacterized surface protein with fasciclin (FAS1) repeats
VIDGVLGIPSDPISLARGLQLTNFDGILTALAVIAPSSTSENNPVALSKDVTIFAPNSASALTTVQGLLNTTNATALEDNLFVIGHVLYSPYLTDGSTFTTLSGKPLIITRASNGTIYVNSSRVVAFDYLIDNGVLHVIDR